MERLIVWTVGRLNLNAVGNGSGALRAQPSLSLLAVALHKPLSKTTTEIMDGKVGELAVVIVEWLIGVLGTSVTGPHQVRVRVAEKTLEKGVHLYYYQ